MFSAKRNGGGGEEVKRVSEIYEAKADIRKLSIKSFRALRSGDKKEAAKIRKNIEEIKADISRKYSILLD